VTQKYKAVVQQTKDGHRGRFAIAITDDIEGSITFSLEKSVWEEDDEPEPGTLVVLSGLIRKQAGWRARRARFLTPDDLKQLASKKQSK